MDKRANLPHMVDIVYRVWYYFLPLKVKHIVREMHFQLSPSESGTQHVLSLAYLDFLISFTVSTYV